jgi:phosphatidylinositol-bisphosphatase
MWVTFKDGQAALTAASKRSTQICGVNLTINLKTEDWLKTVEKEMELCTPNCIQLCDYIDVSPNSDYNCLGIPVVAPDNKNKPTRPPLPKSPNMTPKQTRHQVSF